MYHAKRSRAWFCLAAVYFAAGIVMGIVMGASGDHALFPVHAHLNLLGWVSMALFGLISKAHPAIAEGRVASLHFWLYNAAVPVMLGALALRIKGLHAAEPVIGLASVAVGCATLLFVWLVFARAGARKMAPESAASPTQAA